MSNLLPTRRDFKNVVLFREEEPLPSSMLSNLTELSISVIILPPSQARRYFDPVAMSHLSNSIKQEGILQPLLVRPVGSKYELVAGERRYRAAQNLGLETVPVTVKQLTTLEAQLISLTENLQREDLNPVEETEGILALLSLKLDCEVKDVISLLNHLHYSTRRPAKTSTSSEADNITHNVMGEKKDEIAIVEEVFQELGSTWQSFLKNRLPLLNLPSDVLQYLREGKIAYTKGKAISKVKDQTQRESLLMESVEFSLSLSQIRERVNQLLETDSSTVTPQQKINDIASQLKKSHLWKNPKKWRKAEALFQKILALLESDSS